MSEDVIVVGAGPAGATAAYVLAKEGYEPLVLERGRYAGSKTVYGGKVHASPLKKVFGEEFETCPIERWITRERFTLCGPKCSLTLEYRPLERSYFTAYLPELSRWVAGLAEQHGAMLITETVVDRLVVKEGRVVGVVTEDGEELGAKAVIVAEGANSLVLENSGLVERPSCFALGAKYVIGLEDLEKRLGIGEGEGLSWLFMGFLERGGGFLYTFGDKVSVGVVLHRLRGLSREFYELVEDFRHLPPLEGMLEGGELVEYAAHIIPIRPRRLYGKGFIVAGDAAGLLANHGFSFRGVDHAIYSGYLAGKAVAKGLKAGGFEEMYARMLGSSYVMKNLNAAKRLEGLIQDKRLYLEVPKLLNGFLSSLMDSEVLDEGLRGHLMKAAREAGLGKGDLLSILWRLFTS